MIVVMLINYDVRLKWSYMLVYLCFYAMPSKTCIRTSFFEDWQKMSVFFGEKKRKNYPIGLDAWVLFLQDNPKIFNIVRIHAIITIDRE
jgi:hypothetical protein